MTIDINKLRADKGGDAEAIRAAEKRRCRSGSLVDKVIAVDDEWRKVLFEMEQARRDQNTVNKEIAAKKKAKEDCEELIKKSTELKAKVPELTAQAKQKENERDALLMRIGNIVDDDVVASNDEAMNDVLRTWGSVESIPQCDGTSGKLAHYEILSKLNGVEMKKANEIAGHRAYYLMGYGCMLNHALIQYGLSFLYSKGYTPIQPPFFLKREPMTAAAELSDFEETLYKIPSDPDQKIAKQDDAKREDLFLIATSEQPLCALHAGEYLEEKDLPKKYAGFSTCFRKEAGSHGKDMKGIFRVHQFEKVEQFIICTPEESKRHHEEMIQTSEEFIQSLEIPYRIVSIVAGALNNAAAKKYDLEAWFPSYNDFRELVSCSNCTDYQSRDLNIRLGAPKMMEREKALVHMLNGTLCATERTMCCLVEHYQTPHGIKVPRVLQPYMHGLTFLPYKE
eukprot:Blabericola_migrator_1__5185@NODE_2673_length_2476_cov_178_674554_g1672_i0_p1_GENE_NODE_2673_length_2476_cov_178_674554_g1672_i0NODE_2673_length_2476_cov_178_674554_g1672_i0_p1_ORF_typecomplete_len452_score103_08tRNAsynt_2b/PF00587_25/6_3e03tRNAsynt_2b/PF00587_25/8_8e48Seryl_tRNA_N/PF02403_22/1_1e26Phage_GP20/PF06810_11/0_028HMMR_C/PF15908_5/0_12BBS2_N/PF14781_6/4_8e02BBS2_N/PF14781_6/7_3e03BBS2_N/PF14781_6/2_3bZIP_Maf/PF03131_17/1_4UPF0242/PF06785_11/0_22UPF0242/PF06785_11/4_6e03Uso1_p115_C/PF0